MANIWGAVVNAAFLLYIEILEWSLQKLLEQQHHQAPGKFSYLL